MTMGYPASVGLLWQVSDRFAIRPDIAFSWSSYESTFDDGFPTEFEGDSTRWQVGMSVLVSVARWENLHAYVAPRVAYSRATGRSRSVYFGLPPDPNDLERESKTTGYETGVSFGARYRLGERFALFGEVGASYYSSKASPGSGTSRDRAFANHGGAGVVLFF
jgi:hypothetical protein